MKATASDNKKPNGYVAIPMTTYGAFSLCLEIRYSDYSFNTQRQPRVPMEYYNSFLWHVGDPKTFQNKSPPSPGSYSASRYSHVQ